MLLSRGWEERNGELVFNEFRVSVLGDEVLEMVGGNGCATI